MKNFILNAMVAVVLISVVVVAMTANGDAAKQEIEAYCELVVMWEHDAARGIDEWNRTGHPNYKRIDCGE